VDKRELKKQVDKLKELKPADSVCTPSELASLREERVRWMEKRLKQGAKTAGCLLLALAATGCEKARTYEVVHKDGEKYVTSIVRAYTFEPANVYSDDACLLFKDSDVKYNKAPVALICHVFRVKEIKGIDE